MTGSSDELEKKVITTYYFNVTTMLPPSCVFPIMIQHNIHTKKQLY